MRFGRHVRLVGAVATSPATCFRIVDACAVCCISADCRAPAHFLPRPLTMKTTIEISASGALLLARLLRPRVEQLTDLLDAQVRCNAPGDESWADTADQLADAADALNACENACLEAGA